MFSSLIDTEPDQTLFHYTSFEGLNGIVRERAIWASDARFMNDSQELIHTLGLLKGIVFRTLDNTAPEKKKILTQFIRWAKDFAFGHQVLIGSFTTEGNQLSQWRAYARGGGVSIGLHPDRVRRLSKAANYRLARCIYGYDEQHTVVEEILRHVIRHSEETGTNDKAHEDNSYYKAFAGLGDELLFVAAAIKHDAFREEHEWRVISPIIRSYKVAETLYRPSRSTLVPYRKFPLVLGEQDGLVFDMLVVGPGPMNALSMESIPAFLASKNVNVGVCINSMAPLRD